MGRQIFLKTLRDEILSLQGLRTTKVNAIDIALAPLRHAFPNSSFPTTAVHEFITTSKETSAATSGFVAGILTSIMKKSGATLWISTSRKIFPPALKAFGIEPDQFIFVDLQKEKDVMWAMDEALKCDALSAVVAEMKDLSFTESRRLQLAVERSRVPGFVLRTDPKKISTTACVSRWKITSALTEPNRWTSGHRTTSLESRAPSNQEWQAWSMGHEMGRRQI
ncbi:MAG: Error-prone repair protein ImuA [Bacteroidota bacterium]